MEVLKKEFEKYLTQYHSIDEYDLNTVIYEIFDVKNFDKIVKNYTHLITKEKECLIKIKGELNDNINSVQELSNKIFELFEFILYGDFRVIKRKISTKEMIYEFFTASDFIKAYFSGEIIVKGKHYEDLFKIYKKTSWFHLTKRRNET